MVLTPASILARIDESIEDMLAQAPRALLALRNDLRIEVEREAAAAREHEQALLDLRKLMRADRDAGAGAVVVEPEEFECPACGSTFTAMADPSAPELDVFCICGAAVNVVRHANKSDVGQQIVVDSTS